MPDAKMSTSKVIENTSILVRCVFMDKTLLQKSFLFRKPDFLAVIAILLKTVK